MAKTFDINRLDRGSVEVGGDRTEYPDFTDAYIISAQWDDGTELTQEELDILELEHGDVVNELIFESTLP